MLCCCLPAAVDDRSATAPLASSLAARRPPRSGWSARAAPRRALGHRSGRVTPGSRWSTRAKTRPCADCCQSAGVQWAGAMLLGFARAGVEPALRAAARLASTAATGGCGRSPPWWLACRGRSPATVRFEPARPERWEQARGQPARRLRAGGSLASAALVWVWAIRPQARRNIVVAPAQAMSTRVGYPGLVLATGLGALLLLDLSAQRLPGQPLPGALPPGPSVARHAAVLGAVVPAPAAVRAASAGCCRSSVKPPRRAARRLETAAAPAVAVVLRALGGVRGVRAWRCPNMRQLTSKLGRVWLIVGAAWFFFLRAGPLAERLARGQRTAVARSGATSGRCCSSSRC